MNGLKHAEGRPGIYLITQVSSGLVYVGSSSNVKARLMRHRGDLRTGKHTNPHLLRVWQKHGEVDFQCAVLEYIDDIDELIEAEQRHMDAHRSADRKCGFNIIPFANRQKMSEETKAKISAAGKISQLGKVHSAETRARISESLRGKKLSAETIEKRSAKRRGVPLTPSHRAAVGAGQVGRKMSEQTRALMSAAKIGLKPSEESLQRRSESIKKTLAAKTPEQRGKGRKQAPEVIARRTEAIRESWANGARRKTYQQRFVAVPLGGERSI